jgi:hypothetical protein
MVVAAGCSARGAQRRADARVAVQLRREQLRRDRAAEAEALGQAAAARDEERRRRARAPR